MLATQIYTSPFLVLNWGDLLLKSISPRQEPRSITQVARQSVHNKYVIKLLAFFNLLRLLFLMLSNFQTTRSDKHVVFRNGEHWQLWPFRMNFKRKRMHLAWSTKKIDKSAGEIGIVTIILIPDVPSRHSHASVERYISTTSIYLSALGKCFKKEKW